MLTDAKPMCFIATSDSERARAFYSDVLDLKLVADEPWALVYDLAGTTLRVQKSPQPFTPHPFTALGWHVASVELMVPALQSRGVVFERFPWMNPDADWWSPGGPVKVAWFKDPDGNLLSLTEG